MQDKPMVGSSVLVYGQQATIVSVVTVDGEMLVYLDHPVVVPSLEYTRDYVKVSEIQKIK